MSALLLRLIWFSILVSVPQHSHKHSHVNCQIWKQLCAHDKRTQAVPIKQRMDQITRVSNSLQHKASRIILSIYLPIYLSVYPSIHPSIHPFTYVSTYLPILSITLPILSIYLPILYLSIYLPTYLPYLSPYLSYISIYLHACLPIYLSTYLPILSISLHLLSIYLATYFYSCYSHLEHRASVKRFVSLQFLNLRQWGINPSEGRYLQGTTHSLTLGAEPSFPAFYGTRRFITVFRRSLHRPGPRLLKIFRNKLISCHEELV
jgi:hypothetical protein